MKGPRGAYGTLTVLSVSWGNFICFVMDGLDIELTSEIPWMLFISKVGINLPKLPAN